MDGMKTGYIRASGYNLVASVRDQGRHVVAVVLGGKSPNSRNAHMKDLIQRHLMQASDGERTVRTVMVGAQTGDTKKFVKRVL